MVYPSDDGVNPAFIDNITKLLHPNSTDEENCVQGGIGDSIFHNSFSVIYSKNY